MTERAYPDWLFRVVVPVMTVIVTLGIIEVALNLMTRANLVNIGERGNALPLWEAVDDHRPFALRENFEYEVRTPDFDMHIRTNDFGLRENQPIAQLLDHEFRILSMGDSHTFGYGVNYGERYSDLFNGILHNQAIAFTSGYANGFSPVDYAGYLNAFYSYLLPDIVVLGFFPENDVVNDVVTRQIARDSNGDIVGTKLNGSNVVDGFLTTQTAPRSNFGRTVVRIKNWMWNTFALYRLAEETRNVIRYRLHPNLANTQLPPMLFGDNANQEEIDIALGALEQIDQFLKARGKTLLVAFIPSNFQIAERYERAVTSLPGYRVDSTRMVTAREVLEPQTSFGRWLQAKHIRYVDPTQEFIVAESEGTRLYFDSDGHLNRNGHGLFSKLIQDYLLGNQLVPCHFLTLEAAAGAGCPR